MFSAYFDKDFWHERIEREFRGRAYSQQRHYLHGRIDKCDQILNSMPRLEVMSSDDILMIYETFTRLYAYADREREYFVEEVVLHFRREMLHRLDGQIMPETHPKFFKRTGSEYDYVQFI